MVAEASSFGERLKWRGQVGESEASFLILPPRSKGMEYTSSPSPRGGAESALNGGAKEWTFL